MENIGTNVIHFKTIVIEPVTALEKTLAEWIPNIFIWWNWKEKLLICTQQNNEPFHIFHELGKTQSLVDKQTS